MCKDCFDFIRFKLLRYILRQYENGSPYAPDAGLKITGKDPEIFSADYSQLFPKS
jgi:hypothetical protein